MENKIKQLKDENAELKMDLDGFKWLYKRQLLNIERAVLSTIEVFGERIKNNVSKETGVICCSDVDQLAQTMAKEIRCWWDNNMDKMEQEGCGLYKCPKCDFKYAHQGAPIKGLKYCPECGTPFDKK